MSDKWNVMVYQAGDNNLSGEMIWALQQIKKVGPSRELEVRVQFDPIGSLPLFFEFKTATTEVADPAYPQWHIRNNLSASGTKSVMNDVEKLLDQAVQAEVISRKQKDQFLRRRIIEESSSPIMIEQFLDRTMSAFGNRNILVLSGHGSGALGGFLKDDNPISSISIPGLGNALRGKPTNLRHFDILAMDSCNMSMVEVCYEVRSTAEYLVGSESLVMNSGWPYGEILSALKPQIENSVSTAELAKTMVREYVKFYADYAVAGVSVDLSAIRLERMDSLTKAVRALSETLDVELNKGNKNAILLARWEAQTYSNEEYVDLWDFCDRLQTYFAWPTDSQHPCQAVKDTIEAAVIESCYSGPAFQYSHGLSVYFPWTASDLDLEDYTALGFSTESKWVGFLSNFIKTTRRAERNDLDLPDSFRREIPPQEENLLLIRKNPPHDKGGSLHRCKVKNYPNKFYPSSCVLTQRSSN